MVIIDHSRVRVMARARYAYEAMTGWRRCVCRLAQLGHQRASWLLVLLCAAAEAHNDSDVCLQTAYWGLPRAQQDRLVAVELGRQVESNVKQRVCLNRGTWTGQQWHSEDHCGSFVARTANGTSLKSILFLGDSTTMQLSSAYATADQCKLIKSYNHCGMDQFLGVDRSQTWTPPAAGVEGPVHFGTRHPGCVDCTSCNPSRWLCKVSSHHKVAEYIPVHFSRSVEIQTDRLHTTQENVLAFLAGRKDPMRDMCVVSVGFHDLKISNPTDDVFASNAKSYVSRLCAACRSLVWIGLGAVQEDSTRWWQSNARVARFNQIMTALLNSDEVGEACRIRTHARTHAHPPTRTRVAGIDTFEMTRAPGVLKDAVHAHGFHYAALQAMLLPR